jgi:hypothetical protein
MIMTEEQLELLALNALMAVSHTFEPGDLVEWKPGLQNKRSAGPFVVHQVLDEPVIDSTDDTGSCYFREPLDFLLGIRDREGDFVIHHYDSRRFQPVALDETH